jgi:flagellar biosynthetic protein FliQ
MHQEMVIALIQKMFVLTLLTSLPVLLSGVIIGLAISIFQTVTQIQESTITFVPKIVGGIIILIILMPWMINLFISYTNEFMEFIPQLIAASRG